MRLYAECPHVEGTVLWYAKAAVDNVGGYATQLQQRYWRWPALQPTMPFISKTTPRKPRKLAAVWMSDDEQVLCWTPPRGSSWKREALKYVIYRFREGEPIDTDNTSHMVAITTDTFYRLPQGNGSQRYVYVVTALNRMQNESKPAKTKVVL